MGFRVPETKLVIGGSLTIEAVRAGYALRRREIFVVAPLTLIAAAGLSVWVTPGFAAPWAAAVIALFAVDLAAYRALARRKSLPHWAGAALCLLAAALSCVYSLLPLRLLVLDNWTAAVGAVCVLAASSLRNMHDVALSARIGVASVAPYFLAALAIPFIAPSTSTMVDRAFAAVAVLAMLGYIAQGWLHRQALERARQQALEEARAQTRARLEAEDANSAKSRFLANMSHELRTPLNAIIGYAEMVRETALEERRAADAADLDRVLAASHHLLGLIGDVLDFSKIEAGKMEPDIVRFNVAGLVRDAAEMVRPAATANGNRLTVLIATAIGEAETDALKLKQGLLNLLSNAVKFTRDGDVVLDVRCDGDMLVFAVRDTGPGLTQVQVGQLFQPFVQADQSPTRKHDGTGLGLAITRKLARLLGGDVTVKSEPGLGSAFVLTVRTCLPAATPFSIAA
jgi:signal transduction histidine kinase